MKSKRSLTYILKPSIPKRYLFFVAGLVWTTAGGILWCKGFAFLSHLIPLFILKISISILAGLLLYGLLFSKIAAKHIHRILQIPQERPCFFAFFDWKGYIIMALMISMGIIIRKINVVNPSYLSLFYIGMGTPLLISAAIFFISGIKTFREKSNK